MNIVRIVLDTNVIISSLCWVGNERTVLEHCLRGSYQNILSPFIIDEVQDVLTRKFHANPAMVIHYVQHLMKASDLVFPSGRINILTNDPSDNLILESATLGEANLIVTGDRHLLDLKMYRGIRMLRACEMIEQSHG